MSDTPDRTAQPKIECDECLQIQIRETNTLLTVLAAALPPALWANTATIRLQQIHQHIPTQPALRIICLRCELLNQAGEGVEQDESWYLTAYDWHKSFVAARATHNPQMAAVERVTAPPDPLR